MLEAPRSVICSLCPRPPLCCSTTPGASLTSVPSVVTSARREETSTTVVRAVGHEPGGTREAEARTERDVDRGELHRHRGLAPGNRRHAQCRAETGSGPPPSAHRPPSALFSEERRPASASGVSGAAPSGRSPGSRIATQAAPRWRLHVQVRPPTFPRSSCPQWRPTEDVEPARFLGPLRSQWRDRAGLSPASLLGPTWAPGGNGCVTQGPPAAQASATGGEGFDVDQVEPVADAGRHDAPPAQRPPPPPRRQPASASTRPRSSTGTRPRTPTPSSSASANGPAGARTRRWR